MNKKKSKEKEEEKPEIEEEAVVAEPEVKEEVKPEPKEEPVSSKEPDKRKKIIRKKFLELVEDNDKLTKFDYNKYICGTGGAGILKDALGAFSPYDRKLFKEVLDELEKEGKLYHIGGTMYTLTK